MKSGMKTGRGRKGQEERKKSGNNDCQCCIEEMKK